MKVKYCLIIYLIYSISLIYAQTSIPELYLQGKTALEAKNFTEAEKFFLQSIQKNKDAGSYYQLAKLYLDKDDPVIRNRGNEYCLQALRLMPDSIEYRYLYVEYLKVFGGVNAIEKEYRSIYNANPTQARAIFKLAEIKFDNYEKYRVLKVDSDLWLMDEDVIPFDMTELAKVDLDSAEALYLKGLKIDSTNYSGLFGIVRMYQTTIKPEKAIEYLEKIRRYYPDDKDVHLQLGVYYYKKKRLDDSFKELQIAVGLMGDEEKEDFVYNSAIKLLEPKYLEVFRKMNKEEKSSLIEKLWKASDPLYLSDYNERIMEHYARVAYANLFFSVPNIKLKGWQSDRGQVLIRYGDPVSKQRIKQNQDTYKSALPYIKGNSKVIIPGDIADPYVEIWEYNHVPGFLFSGVKNYYKFVVSNEVDEIWRNKWEKRFATNYAMPSRLDSRATINSLKDYESIKRQMIQSYKPVLYGNKINLDSRLYSFKKLVTGAEAIVETYLAYSLPTKDTSNQIDVKNYTHETGIFIFDENLNTLIEKRKTISDTDIRKTYPRDNGNMVNCIGFDLNSRKISYVFDLQRKIDSNYYTYRKAFIIPDYNNKVLGISDIVLANDVALDKEFPFGIKRGDISFYPKPNNKFRNNEQFYIYYEAYNLSKDEKKETNFEQVITIRPAGEEGISLKKIVKGITTLFTGEEGVVSLTTNFRTKEENTQIYMQLDISGYKAGKYDLIITINDKISGKSTERKTDLEIY